MICPAVLPSHLNSYAPAALDPLHFPGFPELFLVTGSFPSTWKVLPLFVPSTVSFSVVVSQLKCYFFRDPSLLTQDDPPVLPLCCFCLPHRCVSCLHRPLRIVELRIFLFSAYLSHKM